MHASITDLSKTTLDHAKQLIKELDASWYSYDRSAVVEMLGMLTSAHKQSHEESTVAYLDASIRKLEELEHGYHDWLLQQDEGVNISETKEFLAWFKEIALSPSASSGFFKKVFWAWGVYWVVSWVELAFFWAIMLLSWWMVLGGGGWQQLWYALIVCTLITCWTLFLKWMTTLWWRVIVLALICSGVRAWLMII